MIGIDNGGFTRPSDGLAGLEKRGGTVDGVGLGIRAVYDYVAGCRRWGLRQLRRTGNRASHHRWVDDGTIGTPHRFCA